MNIKSEQDKTYGDGYIDVAKSKKRLVRETLKRYERTGSYVFLKVFKNVSGSDDGEYKMHHQISLTMEEFEKLVYMADQIRYYKNDDDHDKENVEPKTLSTPQDGNLHWAKSTKDDIHRKL